MIFLRTSLVSPFSYALCSCSSTMFITILFLFPKIRHQYDFLLRLFCSSYVSPHVRRLDVKTGPTFDRGHYASNHHIHTVCFCEFAFNAGRAPFIKPHLSDELINSIHFKITRTKRIFENVAFNWSTSWRNRQKIESISDLNDKAGFTCFDWFLLGSHKGVLLSFELIIYLLLLFSTYFLYYAT